MRQLRSVLPHAFIGWALCAATMGTGMALASLKGALIIHAIAAPIIFFGVSLSYFRHREALSRFAGSVAFVLFVMVVDFFVVALGINRSLEMFTNVLGTWIPFALIFASSYLAGALLSRRRKPDTPRG